MPMIRVALDAMGGDHGVAPNVAGAAAALARHPGLAVTLVGVRADIERALASETSLDRGRLDIVEASEVVTMSDPATAPLRQKRDSSIRVAANLVREGKAQALVSAGHTGAAMAASKVVIGAIEGVDRPALATPIPTRGGVAVLVDVGANVDCKEHHLRQFAVMGSLYAELLGVKNPRVGLLSIGEEAEKGTDFTRAVHEVLKKTHLNFVGNMDGKDVFSGSVDVIVCDGFIGNVVLKVSEGLAEAIFGVLKEEFKKSPVAMAGAFLARGVFSNIKKRLDYAEYGGAPLLGVKGTTIICHGRSSARAIENALRVAMECEQRGVNAHIRDKIASLAETERAYEKARSAAAPAAVAAHGAAAS